MHECVQTPASSIRLYKVLLYVLQYGHSPDWTPLLLSPGFAEAPYPVTVIAGRSGQLLDTLDLNLKVTLGHLVKPSVVLLIPLNFPATHQLRLTQRRNHVLWEDSLRRTGHIELD